MASVILVLTLWLGVWWRDITVTEEDECDVKALRNLLDGQDAEEAQ